MAKRAIAITSFGDRDISGLLANLKFMAPELPVRILDEKNCNTHWQGHPRWGQRNSDLHKAIAALSGDYDSMLILDDDMRIAHPKFTEGFDLAEKFGVCLPMNPRKFASIDASIGADVSHKALSTILKQPQGMTAVNMGTIFINRNSKSAVTLFAHYRQIMLDCPCRGPVVMAMAIWKSQMAPYILPEQWCLCAHNIKETCKHGQIVIPPIILHVGHPEVLEWYKTDPIFERVRNAER